METAFIAESQQLEMPAAVSFDGRVTADKVQLAVERIVSVAHPVKVIAFGSRARGTQRPNSDLDLAVMMKSFDPKVDKLPVTHADLDVWMSVDLLVFSQERHEFMKDSIISVHHDIAAEGVTLYDERTGSIDSGAIARIAR